MNIDAILFDFDDTLYAYAPCNEAALSAACAVMAPRLSLTSERFYALHDEVRRALARQLAGQAASHNRVLFFKRMVEHAAGKDDPQLVLATHDAYWDAFYAAMQPARDMYAVLDALVGRYPLALVSNHVTEPQLGKVRRLGLERYFSVIVTSEEVGVEKPCAAVFEHALDRLGLADMPHDRVMMVGDSIKGDIGGARALGMRTVHSREFTDCPDDDCNSDACIARLGELLPLLGAE